MTEIHLSPRETAVLQGLAAGETMAFIGLQLGIHRNTVRCYSESIRRKLNAQTNAAAVARAVSLGLIQIHVFVFEVEDLTVSSNL